MGSWRTLFLLTLLGSVFHATVSQECTNVCPSANQDPNDFESDIRIVTTEPRNVTLSWTPHSNSNYTVQHRLQQENQVYTSSSEVSDHVYTIEGLLPFTDYEVRVCLFNVNPQDCGGCLLCFRTAQAQEKPSPPTNIEAQSSAPQTIEITWDVPLVTNGPITNYIVSYTSQTNGTTRNRTISSNQKRQITLSLSDNILPGVTYNVIVQAVNEFGTSDPSGVVSVTASSASTDPGVLLYSHGTNISYYRISESSLTQAQLQHKERLLISSGANALDIDYHYHRKEIYVTTNIGGGSIIRYSVIVSEDNAGLLDLTVTNTSTIYNGLGSGLSSITVDWVNDMLYWVVVTDDNSQIYSGSLSGDTTPRPIGLPFSGEINSLTVDPIHGYFYWVLLGHYLAQADLSIVENAASNINLTSTANLIIASNVGSFSLDLADSQFFYGTGTYILLQLLSIETPLNERNLGANINQPMTSFGTYVYIIVFSNNMWSLAIRNLQRDSNFNGGLFNFNNQLFDVRMFRKSFQPLPVPPSKPTNIRAQPTNSTVTIQWSPPVYFSVIFGRDAYNSWEYQVDYRLHGSSDSFKTSMTNSTSLTLTNLTAGTLYEFTVTAIGLGGSKVTDETFVFNTLPEDQTPEFLIAGNEGIIRSDYLGENPRYISRTQTDQSTDGVYNSLLGIYYVVRKSGELLVQTGQTDGSAMTKLSGLQDPFALQLDWVSRRLYWVESSQKIVSLSTVNITSSVKEKFVDESEMISDLAVDGRNGVLFWIVGSVIKGKTLNGLIQFDCINLPYSPNASTIDPVNRRLYYIVVTSSMVTVGQIGYNTFDCSGGHITRNVSQLVNLTSALVSMSYAANKLYITHYFITQQSSPTVVYTISADIHNINSNHTLALGVVRANPTSDSSQQFRAISIILPEVQPLPDGLTADMTGDIAILAPPPPGYPNLNNDTSNTTFIDIVWDPSNFMFSPVIYQVLLVLSRFGTNVPVMSPRTVFQNNAQISDQMFSTTVNATVTGYSYWTSSSSVTNVFVSPPALPAQVKNVRVYTYSPLRNTVAITGLVVWDGLSTVDAGGGVENYYVNVYDVTNGKKPLTSENVLAPNVHRWDGPPFDVKGSDTEFSLTIQGNEHNILYYVLKFNQIYEVEVFASNAAGNGTSSPTVTFYTNATTPPLEVLTSSSKGGSIEGERGNVTFSRVTPPITLDTLDRTVYYYNSLEHAVYKRTLDINSQDELFVKMESNFNPLGFGYDWIAQTLYIVGRTIQGKTNIWRVFRLYPAGITRIFGGNDVPSDIEMSVIINPFNGLLHWTEYSPSTPSSRLYQLNLTNNMITSLISSSRKREIDISSLEPTGALVWDTVTERLWLSDRSSGDIVSCDLNGSGQLECQLEVNNTLLPNMDNGLPAESLTLDKDRIYWTQSDDNVIYYVLRNDRDNLLTLPLPSNNTVILATSPGLQPYPQTDLNIYGFNANDDYCLSPDLNDSADRPVPIFINITNTTLAIRWEVPKLPDNCADRVVSSLSLTYRVDLRITTHHSVPGYPVTLFKPEVILTNLLPYTEYIVKVEARNQFTYVGTGGNLFGDSREKRTPEGVPNPVTGLKSLVYGPDNIFLYWDNLNETQLRGNVANQNFFAILNNTITEQTRKNNFNFNKTGLSPNTSYSLSVLANNGVLTSSKVSTITNTTWPFPPQLRIITNTNVSLVAMVILEEHHDVLQTIEAYIMEGQPNQHSENSHDLSSVSDYPRQINFTFTNLSAYTNYDLYIRWTYKSVEYNGMEFTAGVFESLSITELTRSGVPDKPVIKISDNGNMTWNKPDNNGQEIIEYILKYESPDGTNTETIDNSHLFVDLQSATYLSNDVPYTITLRARNSIGQSEESESLMYTKVSPSTEQPWYQQTEVIASIGGGGAAIFIIVILILLICCCCCLTTSKRSGSFSPDYELNRLRALHSHSHSAANPNYLWSRDDYTCTDEDLDLLNKFPRNKLRLETFIDRGEFGEVYQGTAVDILGQGTGPTPVAVKTLRKGSTTEEQRKFLSEGALMSNFNHQNIVKVLGVCLDNDPIYIIMELMPGGDLLKFLREAKREHGPALLTLAELVQIALDVAQGCRYLEQQHFIHRDLAARNCLVSSKGADRVVKIGDFGLAKDLYSQDYYQVEGQRKLPVRWMAPEALLQGKFTIESDIWSYGVLLWEIMTFGNQPYPGRINQEVLQFVTGGGRLDKPENCPGRLYKLMLMCWKRYASERPHFAQIVDVIASFLEHVNNKRDSYYSDDDDEDLEEVLQRRNSRPSRTSSVRSGIVHLARQGSMRIRNSFRRRGSLHRKEELESHQNHTGMNSDENLIEGDQPFRERGPF